MVIALLICLTIFGSVCVICHTAKWRDADYLRWKMKVAELEQEKERAEHQRTLDLLKLDAPQSEAA